MKRSYQSLLISPLEIEVEGNVMTASIVNDSPIESVGQDTGSAYNFSDTIDGASSFNHDWEGGSN